MSKYLKLLGLNLFCMFIFLLGVFITSSRDFQIERADITIIITFFIIGLISIWGIINDKHSYSINLMHWLFIYIFVFNAGMIQYLKNDFSWNYFIDDSLILKANLIIILWCIVYALSYNFKTFSKKSIFDRDINIKNKFFLVLITVAIGVIFINIIGFSNLFSRGDFGNEMDDYSQISNLVISTFVRAIPTIVLAYLIQEKKFKKSKNGIYIFIVFLLNLIVNFPTGSARYWAASIYIGLYLLLKPQKNDKFFFCILFISAFLVVFPVLNAFRYMTFLDVLDEGVKFSSFINFFLTGDFDAYSMICRSLELVSQIGSTGGRQLVGAILFFIPRSIWPSKPIGSGATIAAYQRQSFKNISCPLIAEGIINFGIIGVIIFAIVIGFIIKYLDSKYWDIQKENTKSINVIMILYPFYLGFFFFMFRGDLMSSFSYVVGFSVSAFIIQILFGKTYKSLKLRQDVTIQNE